jgi:hypothetical protein
MLKTVRKERQRHAKTTLPSSAAAQAFAAGIQQDLGARYGDENMKAEGEKLARGAKRQSKATNSSTVRTASAMMRRKVPGRTTR